MTGSLPFIADGSAARVAGVGIGVMGLFRLLVELQHGAGAADILAP
ncbi:MAG: hypothetical protein Q8P41_31410 [Pseudomonadota bacterium]|nr:hypothetical protein [Pseudomonadota bacterium]